jgi:hypothetical protein
MILTHRLVRLIETHADELAPKLLLQLRQSPALCSYKHVPSDELKERAYEIYRHLGEWLLGRDEAEIERRYVVIGSRRYHQKVSLSELLWAIVLTKETLWEFLERESSREFEGEILAEDEMLRVVDSFFDRAIHYAAIGFERARAERLQEIMSPGLDV